MDERKRATLELILVAVDELLTTGRISAADAGKQRLLVALDYVEAGELIQARAVLVNCGRDYFLEYLPEQRRENVHFDRQASEVDAIFGLKWMGKAPASA